MEKELGPGPSTRPRPELEPRTQLVTQHQKWNQTGTRDWYPDLAQGLDKTRSRYLDLGPSPGPVP